VQPLRALLLIALGSPGFIPCVLDDIFSAKPLAEFLIGPLEVIVPMLLSTTLVYEWERRRMRRNQTMSSV
jgi:hypothetical protein